MLCKSVGFVNTVGWLFTELSGVESRGIQNPVWGFRRDRFETVGWMPGLIRPGLRSERSRRRADLMRSADRADTQQGDLAGTQEGGPCRHAGGQTLPGA